MDLLSGSEKLNVIKCQQNLIVGDVVEKGTPVFEISLAEAVTMGDYSISIECQL